MELVSFGDLRARVITPPGALRGVIVLLHGFGAGGDDLVALSDFLDLPRVAWVFPEGPLELGGAYGDARAWWMIDMEHLDRDRTNEIPPGLADARAKMLALLDGVTKRFQVPVVLGGFSQGAMLSTEVALRTDLAIDGLVLMSGTLLMEDEWRPLAQKRAGTPAMVSHGTHDPILPYDNAERLADVLKEGGLAVDFVRFRGQHEIPPVVLEHASALIRQVSATA